MLRGILLLLAIFGVWYYIDQKRGYLPPDIGVRELEHFRDVSPEHYDAAMDHARAFERERHGNRQLVNLAVHASRTLENLRELSMRLPNEAADREKLDSLIQHTEYILQEDMQEGYELCPSPLPLGNYHFRRSTVAPMLMIPKLNLT